MISVLACINHSVIATDDYDNGLKSFARDVCLLLRLSKNPKCMSLKFITI